jgi:hypothetical protein
MHEKNILPHEKRLPEVADVGRIVQVKKSTCSTDQYEKRALQYGCQPCNHGEFSAA